MVWQGQFNAWHTQLTSHKKWHKTYLWWQPTDCTLCCPSFYWPLLSYSEVSAWTEILCVPWSTRQSQLVCTYKLHTGINIYYLMQSHTHISNAGALFLFSVTQLESQYTRDNHKSFMLHTLYNNILFPALLASNSMENSPSMLPPSQSYVPNRNSRGKRKQDRERHRDRQCLGAGQSFTVLGFIHFDAKTPSFLQQI